MPRRHLWFGVLIIGLAVPRTLPGQLPSEGPALTGRVLFENGNPPGEDAWVTLTCWGDDGPRVRTEKNGLFRIGYSEALRNRPGFRASRRSALDLNGCELQASSPGYLSAPLRLGRMVSSNRIEVGTLFLRPEEETLNESISVNSLSAPPDAKKAYTAARKELNKPKPNLPKASKKLESAVAAFPTFGDAWFLLGEVRIRSGDYDGARKALETAAHSDLANPQPYLVLSLMDLTTGHFEGAAKAAALAFERDPQSTEALFYLGAAAFALGDAENAQKHLTGAIARPDSERFPRSFYLLGTLFESKNQSAEARHCYLRFLELEPESKAASAARESLRALGETHHPLLQSNNPP